MSAHALLKVGEKDQDARRASYRFSPTTPINPATQEHERKTPFII